MNPSRSSIKWEAPPTDLYKVNFDASWLETQKDVGIGAVVRNSTGDFNARMSKLGVRAASVEAAELIDTREALQFAVDAGFRDIVLEGDKGAIGAIRCNADGLCSAGSVVADIGKIRSFCNRLICSFIKREGNGVAHILAQYARSCGECVMWLEDPPEWLENALSMDSSSING